MPRKLLLIFFAAVFLRVIFFWISYAQSDKTFDRVFPRFDGYYEISENLLAGNGFSRRIATPFVPDSVRTPLYPLFLAGLVYVFGGYGAVLITQIILSSIIPLLAFRIAIQLFADKRTAAIVAVLLALEPLAIGLASTLQAETLFTALFLGGMTLFLDYWKDGRWRMLVCSTGLFALATLARPTIQFLPLLLVPAVFFLAKRNIILAFRHSLIIAVVFVVILAPWSARNFVRFGNPALTVQYASVPYGYLIPSAIALEKKIGFAEAQKEFYENEGGIKDVEEITLWNASFYKKRAAKILKEHPIGIMKSTGMTFFTFFTHDGYLDILHRLNIAPFVRLERPAFTLLLESPKKAWEFMRPFLASSAFIVILGRIAWIFIAAGLIVGAVRYLRAKENRAKGIFILLVILYFAATTVAVGFSVNARFRFPVNALIVTFAVYGILNLVTRNKKSDISLHIQPPLT